MNNKLTHSWLGRALLLSATGFITLIFPAQSAWAKAGKTAIRPARQIIVQFAQPFQLPDINHFRSALRTISSNTVETKHFERNLDRAYKNAQATIVEDEKSTLLEELSDYIDDHESLALKTLSENVSVRRIRILKALLDKAFAAPKASDRAKLFSQLTHFENEQCHNLQSKLAIHERAIALNFYRAQGPAAQELKRRIQEAMAFRRSVFQEQVSRVIPAGDSMRIASIENQSIIDEPRRILATLYRLHEQRDRIIEFGRSQKAKQYTSHYENVFGNLTPESVSIEWLALTKLIQMTAIRRASEKVASVTLPQCQEVKHIADIVRSRLTDREKNELFRTGRLPTNYYGLRHEAARTRTGSLSRSGLESGFSLATTK